MSAFLPDPIAMNSPHVLIYLALILVAVILDILGMDTSVEVRLNFSFNLFKCVLISEELLCEDLRCDKNAECLHLEGRKPECKCRGKTALTLDKFKLVMNCRQK